MEFEWDEEKAKANEEKHNVAFDQATKVFDDPARLIDVDDRENYGEERLRVIGRSFANILTVICVEKSEDCIRIISARRADKSEMKFFFDYWAK